MRHSRLNGLNVEINMFIQKSAEVFIYFSSAHAWGRRRSCPFRKRSMPFLRKIFDLEVLYTDSNSFPYRLH